MDELLATVWKDPAQFFLAHPRTIAAFGQECNKAGVYPTPIDVGGTRVPSWRGVPIYPANKIPLIPPTRARPRSCACAPVRRTRASSACITPVSPTKIEPSLLVRFMGINDKAVINYLVSLYYSAAVLVPDALGILESVEIGRSEG